VVIGVYSGWDSFLLNMVAKFFLKNYLLYDFLLRDGGEVFLESEVFSLCLACPGRELSIVPKYTSAQVTRFSR